MPEPTEHSNSVRQDFHVLVFDEREAICRALCDFLMENGIGVVAAATSREAISALEGGFVHGAVLDPWAGQNAGVELVRWIWQNRPALRRRVVLTSATTVDDAALSAHSADSSETASPSCTRLRELLQTIRSWAEESTL